jgi:hypothetical protein
MRPRLLLKSILALLLAVTVLSGSAAPTPWLWTCRHAGRLVAVPFAARSGEMPCGMPMDAMGHGGISMAAMGYGGMACCRHHALSANRLPGTRAALTESVCHPVFVRTASLPAGVQARNSLAPVSSDAAAIPAHPQGTGASPLTESLRKQRPPPDLPSCRDLFPSHGLRAPPSA